MVELSHDSRPIIGRGPPLVATFITLAIASIALMVTDQRYDQLERVRGWLTAAAYPVQVAVDTPFRAWNWLTGSFADRDRLRQENLEVTARLRLANLQLQRFAAIEEENRRLRDMRENSAGVAERALVASILNVDLDPFRHRVLLDKGKADGVFKGQAVLDGEGIFGQVWRVNERSAEVILISDAEHAIPVQSNRSGVRTIAVGTGDLDPARAALRDGGIGPEAGRPAALHRHGRSLSAGLSRGEGHQGRTQLQGDVRDRGGAPHGRARPGSRGAAGVVQGPGARASARSRTDARHDGSTSGPGRTAAATAPAPGGTQ